MTGNLLVKILDCWIYAWLQLGQKKLKNCYLANTNSLPPLALIKKALSKLTGEGVISIQKACEIETRHMLI